MNRLFCTVSFLILCLTSTVVYAGKKDFTGTWIIDIRSNSERNADCGHAYFTLLQKGNCICGDHVFYTPGCGRLNEGDPGSVRGSVVGNTAVLYVTSGRNGAVVKGKMIRKGDKIHWMTLEEIKLGEPEGDSALILYKGTLQLDKTQAISKELIDACKFD